MKIVALTSKRRIAYLMLGLPAVVFSVMAPFGIYYGLWAYMFGSDPTGRWLLPTVIEPVIGLGATASAGLLLLRPVQPSRFIRLVHTVLLCGGIAVAISMVGPIVGLWFSLFVLSPAVVAGLLIHHLWGAAQPTVQPDGPASGGPAS